LKFVKLTTSISFVLFLFSSCKDKNNNQLVVSIDTNNELILPIFKDNAKAISYTIPSDLIEGDSIVVVEIDMNTTDYTLFTIDYTNFFEDDITADELLEKSIANIPIIPGKTQMYTENQKKDDQCLVATRIFITGSTYDAVRVVIYNNLHVRMRLIGLKDRQLMEYIFTETMYKFNGKNPVKKPFNNSSPLWRTNHFIPRPHQPVPASATDICV
jgi:hypothetical protein